MGIDRRHLFAAIAGAGAVGAATNAQSMPMRDGGPRSEIDAASLGLRANAAEDQTQVFQRAIDQAAAARAVLRLAPGFYRAGVACCFRPTPRSPALPGQAASSCREGRR